MSSYRPGDVVNAHRLNASGTAWEPLMFAGPWDFTAAMLLTLIRREGLAGRQVLDGSTHSRWADIGTLSTGLDVPPLMAAALWGTTLCYANRMSYPGGRFSTNPEMRAAMQMTVDTGTARMQAFLSNKQLKATVPDDWIPDIAATQAILTRTFPWNSNDTTTLIRMAGKVYMHTLSAAALSVATLGSEPETVASILGSADAELAESLRVIVERARPWSGHNELNVGNMHTDPFTLLRDNFSAYPELQYLLTHVPAGLRPR